MMCILYIILFLYKILVLLPTCFVNNNNNKNSNSNNTKNNSNKNSEKMASL